MRKLKPCPNPKCQSQSMEFNECDGKHYVRCMMCSYATSPQCDQNAAAYEWEIIDRPYKDYATSLHTDSWICRRCRSGDTNWVRTEFAVILACGGCGFVEGQDTTIGGE